MGSTACNGCCSIVVEFSKKTFWLAVKNFVLYSNYKKLGLVLKVWQLSCGYHMKGVTFSSPRNLPPVSPEVTTRCACWSLYILRAASVIVSSPFQMMSPVGVSLSIRSIFRRMTRSLAAFGVPNTWWWMMMSLWRSRVTRNEHAHILPRACQPMRKQSDWGRSCTRSTDCARRN